ncbi:MAG: aldehyde dehydrogenase family protein [Candidatus Micrarchaeota archaeon]|nr:aldehyde dehydrogenase family protein [Candidatus Micrarchaeota archaeon]
MPSFQNESTYKTYVEQGNEQEFDRLFDEAVERARREELGRKHGMFIGGSEVFAAEELVENSPIDGAHIGTFQKGTREHASQAVAAARAAFDAWSGTDYRERVKIMQNAAELFRKHKFEIAAILSIENGKSRYESVGEVDEAIDFLNYYSDEMLRNKGFVRKTRIGASSKQVSAGFQGAPGNEERITLPLRPYGVFGVIAPFNFPISISTGMSTGALITGNTVVFKPSSTDNMTMLTGLKIYEMFREAGVPAGAFNYITGPGSEVGDELVASKDVNGIAFTGSRETGMAMMKKALELGLQKTFIVEMGGKNPAIVSKKADINDAVDGIASAAFGFDGQKCSACSRVYVQETIKEEFVSKLIDKMRSFRIGDPLKKETYMGPLISGKALQKYKDSIEGAKQSGKVLYGGNEVNAGLHGAYVEPALVEVGQDNMLVHEELFVPILVLGTFKKFDEALQKANDVEFGLTAGLYSKNRGEINEFAKHIQAGVVYINRRTSATTGAIVGMHTFGGWKGSGLTGKGTGSRYYLPQFMHEQSVALSK